MPLYLSAGDRDRLNAVHHARLLKRALEPHQLGQTHMDVFPGGHTWRVWGASLPRGLDFMFRHLKEPLPIKREDARIELPESASTD